MIIRDVPFDSPWYEQSKTLRQDVLRTPVGLILNEKDVEGEEKQIHIAAIEDDKVMGVMILKLLENGVIKFRQVAVAQHLHGKGVGKDMMLFSEHWAAEHDFTHVEISARIKVQAFYEKLGYVVEGEPYKEVGLDTIKMVKTL